MENLLFAILLALNSYFGAATTPEYPNDIDIQKKAQYILENNLYKVNDSGVIIDPTISL
jgi:hypothetical protein